LSNTNATKKKKKEKKERQTPQWPKEKGQKDKQHAHISTDRVTRTPQIIASCPFFHDIVYIKKNENTKVTIRSRKWKDRQYNSQNNKLLS
jgi:hypothetical protein